MKGYQPREVVGGIFVLVAMVVVIFLVIFVGEKHGILEEKVVYNVLFDDVVGLQEGAEVKVAGVSVGYVDRVHLVYREDRPYVLVTAVVLRKYVHQIRKDSTFGLSTVGVLGDTILTVSPGSREQEELVPTSEIKGASPYSLRKLTGGFERVVEEIAKFSGNTEEFLHSSSEKVNRLAPKAESTLDQIHKTSREIEITSRDLKATGVETLAAVRDASRAIEKLAKDLDGQVQKGKLLKFELF